MRQLVLHPQPDSRGNCILQGAEYRYLSTVLRLSVNDTFEVRLSDGARSQASILSVDKKHKTITIHIHSVSTETPESGYVAGESMPSLSEIDSDFPYIVLFQWILKGPRMDQIIRQATEAGVFLIVPVAGERCLAGEGGSVGSGKIERWERIVREARQQSGSPVPTRILSALSVDEVPAFWNGLPESQNGIPLVLSEAPLARKSLHEYCVSGAHAACLAIGPEGGLSSREFMLLTEAGFCCVHFKTNILRAETAALYGIAAVQTVLMESQKWQLRESSF